MTDAVTDAEQRLERLRHDRGPRFLVLMYDAERAGQPQGAELGAQRAVEAEVAHHSIVDGRVVLLGDERRAEPSPEPPTRIERGAAAVVVGPTGGRGLQTEIHVEL